MGCDGDFVCFLFFYYFAVFFCVCCCFGIVFGFFKIYYFNLLSSSIAGVSFVLGCH